MQNKSIQLRIFLCGLILLGGILLSTNILIPFPVDAQTLLTEASRAPSLQAIDVDHVLHFRTIVYQRIDPQLSDPSDPYHRSMLKQYTDTYIVDTWSRGGQSLQSRSTARDAKSGQVIFDHVYDGDRYIYYNVVSGYASILSNASLTKATGQSNPPLSDWMRNQGLKLAGTKTSHWGKLAWLVQTERLPLSAEELTRIVNQPLHLQKPYIADLNAINEEYAWLIDQESRRLTKFERKAFTAASSVLVESVEYDPSEVLPLNTLSSDWLTFFFDNIPVLDSKKPPISSSISISLKEAIAGSDFTVLLPDALKIGLTNSIVNYKPLVESKETWKKNWRFDIQDASSHGLALEVVYLPKIPDGHAFAIVQGPSKRLVPLMQETFPIWTKSHPVQLTLGTGKIDGWVATGGTLDTNKQVVIILETQGTFFFIVGQGYTEQQVLDMVHTLQPAR